ncbi:MAG TPA: hypothetical protein VH196_04960 [Terriglobales bacterium]|nr:hypothetical protein [Terriglobales bacterium]
MPLQPATSGGSIRLEASSAFHWNGPCGTRSFAWWLDKVVETEGLLDAKLSAVNRNMSSCLAGKLAKTVAA